MQNTQLTTNLSYKTIAKKMYEIDSNIRIDIAFNEIYKYDRYFDAYLLVTEYTKKKQLVALLNTYITAKLKDSI